MMNTKLRIILILLFSVSKIHSQFVELTDIEKTALKGAITAQLNHEYGVKENIVEHLENIYDYEFDLNSRKQVLESVANYAVLGVSAILFVDTYKTFKEYQTEILILNGLRLTTKLNLKNSGDSLVSLEEEIDDIRDDYTKFFLTSIASGGVGKNYITALQLINRILPIRSKVLEVKNNIDNLKSFSVIFPRR